MPEWEHYWKYWKTAFDDTCSKNARLTLFKELLRDLVHKGFLRSEISGLTLNFSEIISKILSKKASEDAKR